MPGSSLARSRANTLKAQSAYKKSPMQSADQHRGDQTKPTGKLKSQCTASWIGQDPGPMRAR